MKRLFVFLALGFIIATSLTSCLKSDDENENSGLTKAEISQCYNAMRGDYSGKMLYYKLTDELNVYDTDTIDVDWTVTADTMLVLKNLPAEVFAGTIADKDLRDALVEQNPVNDLKCYVAFYGLDSYVNFYLGPQMTEYPVFLNDQKTHTVSVVFWSNPYYSYTNSFGLKDLASGFVACQIILGGIYLDDENKNYLGSGSTTTIPIIFSTDILRATKQQSY